MLTYVGVTDGDWYRYLASRRATEVNFWQPSVAGRFGAIPQGSPFLFKSHYPDNRIVGGGFLSGWAALPVSRAWEFFGEDNGCASLQEMQSRIRRYRRVPAAEADPEIGCIMLRDVRFFDPDDAPAAPADWAKNIVRGKSYASAHPEGSYVEDVLMSLFEGSVGVTLDLVPGSVPGPVLGGSTSRQVRVGQGAFKALVQEAYGRRCAITGAKVVPVLEAAHIKPVAADGENRTDNGLLLRSDVHTLFDRGYLGVHPEKKSLLVSPRLRSEWGNGEEFYQRAERGDPITLPSRLADRPHRNFLEWHTDTRFRSR